MSYRRVSDQWVELGATRRTANCLESYNIHTLEQLVCITDEGLMDMQAFGKGCLVNVHDLLRRHWHDAPSEQRKINVANLLLIYESEIAKIMSLEAKIPQQENYWDKRQIGLEADKHKIAIERIREKILAYV
jgi:hypothetical protein